MAVWVAPVLVATSIVAGRWIYAWQVDKEEAANRFVARLEFEQEISQQQHLAEVQRQQKQDVELWKSYWAMKKLEIERHQQAAEAETRRASMEDFERWQARRTQERIADAQESISSELRDANQIAQRQLSEQQHRDILDVINRPNPFDRLGEQWRQEDIAKRTEDELRRIRQNQEQEEFNVEQWRLLHRPYR